MQLPNGISLSLTTSRLEFGMLRTRLLVQISHIFLLSENVGVFVSLLALYVDWTGALVVIAQSKPVCRVLISYFAIFLKVM